MSEKKIENDSIKQEKAWDFQWSTYANDYELKMPTDSNPTNTVTIKKGQIWDGGLTLKNIYHNGYRMAYDIGVIALWVYPKNNAVDEEGKLYKPYKLVLGHKDFEQVNDDYSELNINFKAEKKTKNDTLNSSNDPGSLANFNTYKKSIEHVVTTSWKSRKKLFGENSSHLYITQKYVLTDYNDTPAHEPTGGIFAARLHPMTKIYYENRNDGYLGSVRVDYRLYLSLNTYANKRTEYPGYRGYEKYDVLSRVQKDNVLNNHVGLFKDYDEKRIPIIQGVTANSQVFESSEKPIVAEVFGDGIIQGSNVASIERKTEENLFGNLKTERTVQNTWDNIHWWGAGGNIHASTPGAFHALHIHWRWAETLQKKDNVPLIDYEGEPQFVGQSKGGMLTDPNIENQSIRFAIVKKESLPAREHSEHSTEIFEDFFKNLHAEPSPIGTKPEEGADLVLYYSAEVFAEKQPYGRVSARGMGSEGAIKVPLEGNIFLHGIFFAHQDEKSSLTIGTTSTYYKNPDNPNEKQWKRNPQK